MSTQLKDWQGRNIDPKTSGGGGGGSVYPSLTSITGASGARKKIASMPDGGYLVLTDYPYNNTIGECYSFRAKITSFSKLLVGRGNYSGNVDNANFTNSYCCWLEIDSTNVKVCRPNNVVLATYTHGLTISAWIAVNMFLDDDKVMHLTIGTLNGQFVQNINPYVNTNTPYWYTDASGAVKAVSDGSVFTDCNLSATNKYLHHPFWIFGASYENHSGWINVVRQMGYKNFLHNAYPGRASDSCYADLLRALNYGCPKFLYWTMWGNGTAQSLDDKIGAAKEICDEANATLIIIDRPNSSAQDTQDAYAAKKAVIEKYKALGVRYVDSANALSTNPASPDGWYSGYLSSDGKHPTQLGYKSLAMQVLQDLPEIMQY